MQIIDVDSLTGRDRGFQLEARYWLGVIYYGQKQFQMAIDNSKQMNDVECRMHWETDCYKYAHAYHVLGFSYAKLFMWQEAIDPFERALSQNFLDPPRHISAQLGLAICYRQTGRIAEAIACLVAVVNTTPPVISTDMLEAEEELVDAYMQDKQYGKAVHHCQHLVSIQRALLQEDDLVRLALEEKLAECQLYHQCNENGTEIITIL